MNSPLLLPGVRWWHDANQTSFFGLATKEILHEGAEAGEAVHFHESVSRLKQGGVQDNAESSFHLGVKDSAR